MSGLWSVKYTQVLNIAAEWTVLYSRVYLLCICFRWSVSLSWQLVIKLHLTTVTDTACVIVSWCKCVWSHWPSVCLSVCLSVCVCVWGWRLHVLQTACIIVSSWCKCVLFHGPSVSLCLSVCLCVWACYVVCFPAVHGAMLLMRAVLWLASRWWYQWCETQISWWWQTSDRCCGRYTQRFSHQYRSFLWRVSV